MIKKLVLLFVIVFTFSSCATRKKLAYFQNISEISSSANYEPKLQPDDLVQISISAPAPNQALAVPFNISTSAEGESASGGGASYQLDNQGNIVLPLIGTLKISGLTHAEALKLLNDEVGKYITDPIVSIRLMNFKVTVLGDVGSPGVFTFQGERNTLPEALGMAGDLQITGLRKNILVIREVQGKKTYGYVDLTKVDFMASEYYYLAQNDLIVVEPNKTKMNSSVIGRDVTIAISSISLIITIIAFITR
jgi:polysaccharide export outer membrane protein